MVVQARRKAKSCLTATTLERPGVPVYFLMLFKIFHTSEDLVTGVAHVTVKLVIRMILLFQLKGFMMMCEQMDVA